MAVGTGRMMNYKTTKVGSAAFLVGDIGMKFSGSARIEDIGFWHIPPFWLLSSRSSLARCSGGISEGAFGSTLCMGVGIHITVLLGLGEFRACTRICGLAHPIAVHA